MTPRTESLSMNRGIQKWLWLAPVLLALLANFNVLQNGFGWDDEEAIQALRAPDHWWSLLLPDSISGSAAKQDAPYYRPLIELSYRIDYALWGGRPFGFHLSVLAAHLINTLLVFFLARALAGEQTVRPYKFLPLTAASLFAVYPVHAEAVAWIAGRSDVFCTTFMLSSLTFYLRSHATGRWTSYGLAMVAFALALLTKETAVGLLLIFPLVDYLAIPPGSAFRWRKIALLWLVPFIIICAFFLIRSLKITLPYGEVSLSKVFPYTMIFDMIGAAGLYLKTMAFPYPHHPFIESLPTSTPSIIMAGLSWILLLSGMIFMLLRRNALVGLGLAWTALTIAPAVSGPVLHLPAPAGERYLYAPSAGFLIAIGWLILKSLDTLKTITAWTPRRIGLTAGIILTAVIITFGWESRNRNTAWKSPSTFWETVTNRLPQAGLPYHNLAKIYSSQGNFDKAERFYQQALVIWGEKNDYPNMASSLIDLAILYDSQGRYTEAEPLYRRSLAIREKLLQPDHPDIARSLNNLAMFYQAQGRFAEAESLHRRALAIREKVFGTENPIVAQSFNNIALLYDAQGRYSEAESLYRRALVIDQKALEPDHPDIGKIFQNYAALLRKMKRDAEAASMAARAKAIREKRIQ